MANKNIVILVMLVIMAYMLQSCMAVKTTKIQSNNQIIEHKIKEFLYKINKRKRLKKKRVSYHVDNAREYKNILEQRIVEEQTSYGYIVINRSYISALEIEQDLNNQEDTLNGVDIVIIAKSENRSIILKALTVKNENILTMDVIQLSKRDSKDVSILQSETPLSYYDAIKYCKNEDKTIPTQYDVDNIKVDNILFWTTKRTKNSNMAMIYDPNENTFFEAIRVDTFDVVCIDR